MKKQVKTYRLEWLDDDATIRVLAIVSTNDIKRRLADEIARMMICTAPAIFRPSTLKHDNIIKNIQRGEKHAQTGKEFYFVNIGEQVLMATETTI